MVSTIQHSLPERSLEKQAAKANASVMLAAWLTRVNARVNVILQTMLRTQIQVYRIQQMELDSNRTQPFAHNRI